MNCRMVDRILADTAFVRTGGSSEERRCAEYLKELCAQMKLNAELEHFLISTYDTAVERLSVDGRDVACKAFFGSGCGDVAAPLCYLPSTDERSLKKCKDRIVLLDKGVGRRLYEKMVLLGVKGIITYSGNLHYGDRDVDQKELRFQIPLENRIPCVNVHASDAFDMVKRERKEARITVEQAAFVGTSQNLVLDLKGETEESVVVTAHYDSTSLSVGAYDNMSGCIALLYLAEYFSKMPRRRSIRLVWCGGEERGLLGSMEYCRVHEAELGKTVLNVNLDMLGSVMGEFVAFSCINDEVASFLSSFLSKHRFPVSVRCGIRSSDSNSFLHRGVPALTFARYAPSATPSVHTRYDRAEMVSAKRLLQDMKMIARLTEYFVNEPQFSVSMEISEKIKAEVDEYMRRYNGKGE